MQIYGIGAAQLPDKVGETIDINGIDTTELRVLNDEHGDRLSDILGSIKSHKKIFSDKDIESDRQRKCWDLVRAPFLYIEGEIVDDPEHQDAMAAKSLLRFVSAHPELPLRVGLSVEGSIVSRDGDEQKNLTKTKATGVSLTVKPCNPKCLLFPVTDLMKSEAPLTLPTRYENALKKSEYTPSFKETKLSLLKSQLEVLQKSIFSLMGQFTDVKCWNCGHTDRFFKSSSNWPNGCEKCGDRFTMKQLYKAITK